MTTDAGVPVADNQSSFTTVDRGPILFLPSFMNNYRRIIMNNIDIVNLLSLEEEEKEKKQLLLFLENNVLYDNINLIHDDDQDEEFDAVRSTN
jgi:hypothetical protein